LYRSQHLPISQTLQKINVAVRLSLASISSSTPAISTLEPRFNAFSDWKDRVFDTGICMLPPQRPPQFEDLGADEPEFDPDVHLCIELPSKVTLLDFTEASMTPPTNGNAQSHLAYTRESTRTHFYTIS
jgi:hypothetical protein